MEEKKKMKVLRDRLKERRQVEIEKTKAIRERTKQRQKQKELNEFKSSQYQLINETHKTRKWHKKAKQMLTKLPAEIFYQKFKNASAREL